MMNNFLKNIKDEFIDTSNKRALIQKSLFLLKKIIHAASVSEDNLALILNIIIISLQIAVIIKKCTAELLNKITSAHLKTL